MSGFVYQHIQSSLFGASRVSENDWLISDASCNATADVFACVQNAPEQDLFKVIRQVGKALAPLPSGVDPWQPVVDGTFVPEFPSKLLAEGKFVKVPIIAGFTTDEITSDVPTNLNLSSDEQIVALIEFVIPFVPQSVIAELVQLDPLSAYPNIYSVGGTQWKRTTEIVSDLSGRCPGRAFVRNMTQSQPTWKYRWNAALPSQITSAPELGIVHAADIPYLFGSSYSPVINTPLDLALSLVL